MRGAAVKNTAEYAGSGARHGVRAAAAGRYVMNIRFIVTTQGTGPQKPLLVNVSGYSIELSGMAPGSSIAVGDEGGTVTVSLISSGEAAQAPAGGQCAAVPQPAGEAQPSGEPAASAAASTTTAEQAAPVTASASQAAPVASTAPAASATPAAQAQAGQSLFQHLSALRKKIASEVKLPPYMVFHDGTLKEMCRVMPADLQAFKAIPGVGNAKLEKYGMRFIEAIAGYAAAHGAQEAA